jgi:cytochrome c5
MLFYDRSGSTLATSRRSAKFYGQRLAPAHRLDLIGELRPAASAGCAASGTETVPSMCDACHGERCILA